MASILPQLDVTVMGRGPRVLFVHGSVVGADVTWHHQHELAKRWTLVLPQRPGFGSSPPLARGDFEAEAPLFAELLGDGAHLVGHSYGAVIALHAAALRPDAVRSLAISEPGTLRVAAGVPAVDTMIAHGDELYRRVEELEPLDFLRFFRGGVGSTHSTPEEPSDALRRGVDMVMRERPPWESDPPLDALAAAPFPKLVMSGGHSDAFEAVCDTIAERIGGERTVVAGRKHSIPGATSYNATLEAFLAQ
jgi:pimeloyl-ACP methyl ester carboxylesterase